MATPSSPKQWEAAVKLVHEIDGAFDEVIWAFRAQQKLKHETEALVIQKYRFQSWSYVIGLGTMLGARQPLHGFFSGAITDLVCGLLKQVLMALKSEKGLPSSKESASSARTKNATLQEIFQQLTALFPDNSRVIMKDAFISRVLEPDDGEATFESLTDNAASQEFPDLEVIAAMKRIKLLIERSDAKRSSELRLEIRFKDLTFDKTKSSSISTAVILQRQNPSNQFPLQFLVEWKQYEGFWDTQVGNELFHRVELLTEFLKTASRGSKVLDLRLLDCQGYCHDQKRGRLGFVYAIPKSVGARRSYLRLNALMKDYSNRNLSPPPVGDRMRLAMLLCRSMFGFHKAEWFHKSFSSYNIILFPDIDASDTEAVEVFEVFDYSILVPYVVGFNNSRPSKPDEFSEPAKGPNHLRRYWHPDYKNVPMQKYTHEFDYYSLGIVLLEIGLWSPLSVLTKGFEGQDADIFAKTVQEYACPQLSSAIGSIFQGVVADLLNANHEVKDRADQNELTPLGKLIEFQSRVLDQLGQCRA